MTSKAKPKIVYLPAGMSINQSAEKSSEGPKKSKGKSKPKYGEWDESPPPEDTRKTVLPNRRSFNQMLPQNPELLWGDKIKSKLQINGTKKDQVKDKKQVPPATICKRNSISPEMFNFSMNFNHSSILNNSSNLSTPSDPDWGEIDDTGLEASKTSGNILRLPKSKPLVLLDRGEEVRVKETASSKVLFNRKVAVDNPKTTSDSDLSDWGDSDEEVPANTNQNNPPVPSKNKLVESDSSDWGESESEEGAATNQTFERIRETVEEKCNCDNYVNCTAWCRRNVMFDAGATARGGLPLLKTEPDVKRTISKVCTKNIIIHGTFIPRPIQSADDATFNENIRKYLKAVNGASRKEIQGHVWTSIQRSLNVFVIGTPVGEQSFTYLPAFCSFALEKHGRYGELEQYGGPLVLILCSDLEKCDHVHLVIKRLLAGDGVDVGILVGKPVTTVKDCDILITTPPILEASLKSEQIKLKRLCHVAMEDAFVLLQNTPKEMENLLKVMQSVQKNRPHNKNLQIVVCSEKFTADVLALMRQIYSIPVVFFEDFAEAALYSNITFRKKKLSSAHKVFFLDDILKNDSYSSHKFVVFCSDSEISFVQGHCEVRGIECISIADNLDEDEIVDNAKMWSSLKPGRTKVLLCSDSLFERTEITNADRIVHFSPPINWEQFQRRFRAISKNLCSPFEDCEHLDVISYLITDDTCDLDFYVNFLKRILVTNFILK